VGKSIAFTRIIGKQLGDHWTLSLKPFDEGALFDIFLVSNIHISKDNSILHKLLLANNDGKTNITGFGVA
jgi:hypothetical protein